MLPLPEHYGQLLSMGLAMVRPAAVFLVLPAFNSQSIPAVVRNSIFLGLGLIAFSFHATDGFPVIKPSVIILLREVVIGVTIGLFFSAILYSLEIAGHMIDYVSGRSFATVVDPAGGYTSTLTGSAYARFAFFIFVTGGGLMLVTGVLLESFIYWPLDETSFMINPLGGDMYVSLYGSMMTKAVVFAGPILLCLFLVDLTLGLMSRFAPQMNVIAMSISVKSFLATFVMISIVSIYASEITDAAWANRADMIDILRKVLLW